MLQSINHSLFEITTKRCYNHFASRKCQLVADLVPAENIQTIDYAANTAACDQAPSNSWKRLVISTSQQCNEF